MLCVRFKPHNWYAKIKYINLDGPKMTYINKFKIHEKVKWSENKI